MTSGKRYSLQTKEKFLKHVTFFFFVNSGKNHPISSRFFLKRSLILADCFS